MSKHEASDYAALDAIIDIILIPPSKPLTDINRYVLAYKAENNRMIVERIDQVLKPLRELGIDFQLAKRVYLDYPTRNYALTFTVLDTVCPELTLPPILFALAEIVESMSDKVDFFYFIPIHNGAMIPNCSYRFSIDQLQRMAEGEELSWVFLAPTVVPEPILALLPHLPICSPDDFTLRFKLQAAITFLSILAELENRILPLQTSDDCYDNLLYDKWLDRLDHSRNEVQESIDQFKQFLESKLNSKSDHSAYLNLMKLSENLNELLRSEKTATVILSSIPNLEELMNMVSDLNA